MSSQETPAWKDDDREIEDEEASSNEPADPALAEYVETSLKKLGAEAAELRRRSIS